MKEKTEWRYCMVCHEVKRSRCYVEVFRNLEM